MTKFADRKKKWGEEMVFKSISLPENIIEKLKLLKELYHTSYGRSVSYGEIFERLFSAMSLGAIDPGIYADFQNALRKRSEFDEVVTRRTEIRAEKRTEKRSEKQAERIEETPVVVMDDIPQTEMAVEENMNLSDEEWCQQIVNLWEKDLKPVSPDWTGEWYVHPDGRMYAAMRGKNGEPDYAKVDDLVKCKHAPYATDKELLKEGFRRVKSSN